MEYDEFDEFAEGVNPDEGGLEPQQSSNDGENQQEEQELQEETDFTTEVLRFKGIEDPSKIKFQDESGAIIERDWDSLSKDEQINILVDQGDGSELLDDDEIQLINNIRSAGGSVEDYLKSLMPAPQEPTYKIDELSDDEVYVLNLLDTVGSDNITDDELLALLDVAKLNEGLFNKQVEGLRQKYKQLQEDEEALQANATAYELQLIYNQFANSIQNEIVGLNSFAGRPLELSKDDMEELYEFTLALDDSGISEFGRAMQDPAIFTRAAFWVLNEDEIISELTKLILDNYIRGYNAGKNDSGKSKLVFQPKQQLKNNRPVANSINDLDFDEFN